jgi:hypothetical protein
MFPKLESSLKGFHLDSLEYIQNNATTIVEGLNVKLFLAASPDVAETLAYVMVGTLTKG